jgi:hypothetical protein
MAVSFLADRVYRPRHAAPPGLFWRSPLIRDAPTLTDAPAAADEWPTPAGVGHDLDAEVRFRSAAVCLCAVCPEIGA